MNRRHTVLPLIAITALLLMGWGGTGHRFINSHAVTHLPESMQGWAMESSFFGSHASDADHRKGSDPTEGPKHYIDLELYTDYHDLSDNLDSLRTAVGQAALDKNGILPWATRIAYDSLVAQLRRDDWEKAKLTASDIGHYVGDGHQPLHNTDNYNGQLSGNDGIHSRYESRMLDAFEHELSIVRKDVSYVPDVFAYCLAYSIRANAYVDSIMAADNAAKSVSGWSGSGTPPQAYYDELWSRTRTMTLEQIQLATEALADLWYSAALDAGTITGIGEDGGHGMAPASFGLDQNYPNPFNPTTTIRFHTRSERSTLLTVHDLSGRTVATLFDGRTGPGTHQVSFDADMLAGGLYLYRLQAGEEEKVRKMLYLR